jgi:hypothetical protein
MELIVLRADDSSTVRNVLPHQRLERVAFQLSLLDDFTMGFVKKLLIFFHSYYSILPFNQSGH